jgi:hypothetical protein
MTADGHDASRVQKHIRFSLPVWAYIERHAIERRVSVAKLVDDILGLWILTVTDTKDPVFREARIGAPLPSFESEPHEGYFKSLMGEE